MSRSFGYLVCLILFAACSTQGPRARRVFILGIDGLDPKILQDFMEEGLLPNFKALATEGGMSPLTTTMPPLSPVAWSTFITGMDPAGHGIFDFIHRNPASYAPEFSIARTIPAGWALSLGSWVIPMQGATTEQLRRGTSFWEVLEERGIPTAIFRMPVNFPPHSPGYSLSGMGTPDFLGTQGGTFTLFTTSPPPRAAEITGGRFFKVAVVNHQVGMRLEGPDNPFRQEEVPAPGGGDSVYQSRKLGIDFKVFVDPEHATAKLDVQGRELVLRQGEWSEWVRLDFTVVPYLVSISATARFYLKQVRPDFELYVSPLQINPEDPAIPISTPDDWSRELFQDLGYFYTQELPEDTKALSAGVFTGKEFWEQSQHVYREQMKALHHFLEQFKEGLSFFYFSSVDQGCHMLWRYMDPQHPAYVDHPELRGSVRTLYQEMDEAVGLIREKIEGQDTLIVMSDHGFSPFYWQVNLNSWLAEKGYVRLKDPTNRGAPLFSNVDWSTTSAYALGLNGVYVNLRGREGRGIVSQGADYERLLDRLENDLKSMKDPRNGNSPVTFVRRPRRDLKGEPGEHAPDLIVGYNTGYRTSWKSPLGEFPQEVFEDNEDAWSGDHSIDYRLVPGVLLSNRKISLPAPALYDLTVAVLDEYGVEKLPEMIGEDCLAAR